MDSWCDLRTDCHNEADETDCMESYIKRLKHIFNPAELTIVPQPPAMVEFWGNGTHTVTALVSENGTELACPPTHFQCPGLDYCLPVYLLCNGVKDCGEWQDEADCDSYVCPGFYRCRGSSVCLHADDVCDGVAQCPQGDDELLCELVCPEHCTCHGLAFTCTRPFTPSAYPTLRYLKAAGTGLSPKDLSDNTGLVYLNLASCHVAEIKDLVLPHLHILDLMNNDLSVIDGSHLVSMPLLKVLFVGGNPLTWNIFSAASPSGSSLQLLYLDLSNVSIPELHPAHLRSFTKLRSLNLSGSGVDAVTVETFRNVPELRQVDVRGCRLSVFPQHAFRQLLSLQEVRADSYKVCCPQRLPPDFNLNQCLAPEDPVSSCDSLLGQTALRVLFPLLAVLGLLGNACGLASHVLVVKVCRRFGFGVFLTHLCLSDFVMCVYLALIAVADRVYQDSYARADTAWRRGAVCRMAGVLWLLASEVSALIVSLITLDSHGSPLPLQQVSVPRGIGASCLRGRLVGLLLAGDLATDVELFGRGVLSFLGALRAAAVVSDCCPINCRQHLGCNQRSQFCSVSLRSSRPNRSVRLHPIQQPVVFRQDDDYVERRHHRPSTGGCGLDQSSVLVSRSPDGVAGSP